MRGNLWCGLVCYIIGGLVVECLGQVNPAAVGTPAQVPASPGGGLQAPKTSPVTAGKAQTPSPAQKPLQQQQQPLQQPPTKTTITAAPPAASPQPSGLAQQEKLPKPPQQNKPPKQPRPDQAPVKPVQKQIASFNVTGGPQCWLCSDYALGIMDDIGMPKNETETVRKERHLHECESYDPGKPDTIYGALVYKVPGFKCFVFHENNRSGKVVMRGMLPLEDLKLFELEEDGCKEDVAAGELLENVKFYACSCNTDRCNANTAPGLTSSSSLALSVGLFITCLTFSRN